MLPVSSLVIITAASFLGFALLGMTRYWLGSLACCAGVYILMIITSVL